MARVMARVGGLEVKQLKTSSAASPFIPFIPLDPETSSVGDRTTIESRCRSPTLEPSDGDNRLQGEAVLAIGCDVEVVGGCAVECVGDCVGDSSRVRREWMSRPSFGVRVKVRGRVRGRGLGLRLGLRFAL